MSDNFTLNIEFIILKKTLYNFNVEFFSTDSRCKILLLFLFTIRNKISTKKIILINQLI